jgi:PAS domain S-box-containing protein
MDRLWQLKFWALIAALIGLALGLTVVFFHTLDAAHSVEKWNREYATWHAGQLEADFWRMLETATRYAYGDPQVDRAAVDARFDVVASRAAIFTGGIGREHLQQIDGGKQILDTLNQALNEAQPAIDALKPGDRTAFAPIREKLAAVGLLLKSLTVNLSYFETKGAITSIVSLRGYFILGAVLIAAIILTGIVLVGFLVLEIGVRRRLFNAMLESQAEARLSREREEAALIESGRRFRAIAMANPIAILVSDRRDGALRYANPAAITLLGLPQDHPLEAAMGEFFLDPAALEALVGADADQQETRLRRADGTVFPVALSARALDYDGAPAIVVGILDLTEKQAAQTEIERQREVIYHREKLGALGSLLAGVAHELNNPLSIVVAQATLLEELTTDPATAARGGKIRAAAERCARIVKTFLAMARQRPPSRAAVDLNEAVESALELLGYGLRTAGIEVRRELAPGLPTIWADPDQISQVLTNLIVNAQQALTDWPGARQLTLATRVDESGPRMARLSVTDSGPGVPAAIRSRVFEPFFTTKPVGVGTGIGLSVCHSVVTSHGGTIELEDAPGGGTAFVIRLPLGGGAEAMAVPAKEQASPAGGARVLIVDDEPEVAQTLADILGNGQYRIDVVESGQAALDRLQKIDYSLILSDIRMPNMDGMELYRRLKLLKPALAERVILVTGDSLSPSVLAFLDESGRPRIEKPFSPADIRRLVAAALNPPAEDGTLAVGGQVAARR